MNYGLNGRNIEIYVKFSGILCQKLCFKILNIMNIVSKFYVDCFKILWILFQNFLPLFWWIKVPGKYFGNEILISDCPCVNIAPCALPSLRRPWKRGFAWEFSTLMPGQELNGYYRACSENSRQLSPKFERAHSWELFYNPWWELAVKHGELQPRQMIA